MTPLSDVRIVIAEDSWHVASAMRVGLERIGATVAGIAAREEEMLALLATYPDAVLVADLDLQGRSVTATLRRLADTRPIVVVTGYAAERDALEAEGLSVLIKPVDPQALADCVAEAAGRPTPRAAAP